MSYCYCYFPGIHTLHYNWPDHPLGQWRVPTLGPREITRGLDQHIEIHFITLRREHEGEHKVEEGKQHPDDELY